MRARRSASPAVTRGGDPPTRLRTLFINRSYWPDVEATGQFLTELCEGLADEFEVHVLCGQPQRLAGGESHQLRGSERRNGVTIHRVRHSRFNKASFGGRLANMLTFQASSSWRALRVVRPDVVVTETDPPFLCLIGSMIKRARGCRQICYLQDVYPDVAVALGKLRAGPLTHVLRRRFFAAYRQSDAVVALSDDMRDLLIDGGVPADRIHVVRNWVDVDAIFPVKENNRFRHRHGLEGKFVVMYSGNMGLSQRLDLVLAAAERLRDRSDILFAMIGDGVERRRLEQLVDVRQLGNVRFFDYQPKSQLAESLSAADLHLVILRPEVKRMLMPSKFYGALATGTPVMAVADGDCELAHTVAEHGLGDVLPIDDPAALATAIADYAASPERCAVQGDSARRFAVEHCRREAGVTAWRELLRGRKTASSPALDGARQIPHLAAPG